MGVYIFKHKNNKYIKLGHHKSENPYMRLLNGGFSSNICPDELKNNVYYNDMELLYWFENANIEIEKSIHKIYKDSIIGEWYNIEFLNEILEIIKCKGGIESEICIEYYNDFIIKNTEVLNNHGTSWDADNKSRLKRLLNNNIPINNIAQIMGRSITSIQLMISENLSKNKKKIKKK